MIQEPAQDSYTSRRIAASIIQCALHDAQGRRGSDRAEAVAWLASSRATLYFDRLNMPQSSFLLKSGWLVWAEEILLMNGIVPMEYSLVIAQTLEYLSDYITSSNDC